MKIDASLAAQLEKCRLDHVAVAVKDLAQAKKIYSTIGLHFSEHEEVVESQAVRTAFAPLDSGGAHLELLCPHGSDGPIHQFLQKKGEGIHHLCFAVPDVTLKSQQLKSQGFQLIYEHPVPGANNCLVNFIHPKSTGGVLIEISQKLN